MSNKKIFSATSGGGWTPPPLQNPGGCDPPPTHTLWRPWHCIQHITMWVYFDWIINFLNWLTRHVLNSVIEGSEVTMPALNPQLSKNSGILLYTIIIRYYLVSNRVVLVWIIPVSSKRKLETNTSTNNTTSCYISAVCIVVKKNTSTHCLLLVLIGMGSANFKNWSSPHMNP